MAFEKEVTVVNETGLHTRPGTLFVQEAKKYNSDIFVVKGDFEASAKSLLKVMKIGISQGDTITIRAEGSDAEAAVNHLCTFVENLEG